jgi:hypothetical protein
VLPAPGSEYRYVVEKAPGSRARRRSSSIACAAHDRLQHRYGYPNGACATALQPLYGLIERHVLPPSGCTAMTRPCSHAA